MEVSELFALLESAGDAAFATDLGGQICFWSSESERMLGFAASGAVGRQCAEVLLGHDEAGNDVCGAECGVREAVRRREPVRAYDLHAATSRRGRKWLNVSILAVPVAHGTSPLVVHLVRDIDLRKRIESATWDILVHVGHITGQAAERILDKAAPHAPVALTPREISVLRLLAAGMRTKVAASRLGISPATLRNHTQRALKKLGCHARLGAVLAAKRRGLI
jgi:PAS domain S-box-containing protein